MNRISAIAIFVALSAPIAAFAQTATPPAAAPSAAVPTAKAAPSDAEKAARAKFRTACNADFTKYCADAMPLADATPDQAKAQRGKMRVCIDTHKADLSAGCKAAITERDAAVAAKKS